jgi:hypothetical protein
MAISNQAPQKCGEGSETRLYGLTGFCANSSVEYKGYESPRVPDNQTVQQVWSNEVGVRVLRDEIAVQVLQAGYLRGIQEVKQREGRGQFAGLVFEKQRSSLGAVQGIQLQARGQGS